MVTLLSFCVQEVTGSISTVAGIPTILRSFVSIWERDYISNIKYVSVASFQTLDYLSFMMPVPTHPTT
jgi:hypothetical protein